MVTFQKGATKGQPSSTIDVENLQKPVQNLLIKESHPNLLQRLVINQTRWMNETSAGSVQLPLVQTDSVKLMSTAKKNTLSALFVAALAVTSGAVGYRVGKGPNNDVPAGASALSDKERSIYARPSFDL